MSVIFKLYDSTGIELKYIFPVVFSANYPHSGKKIIEHENVRGKGSIIVDGGEESWTLELRGVLSGTDYDNLTEKIDEMEEDVEINVSYILKITSGVNSYNYNVKRIEPIDWQNDSLRTNFIEYICRLRVNCW